MKSVVVSLALGLAAGAATISFAQDRTPAPSGARPDRGPPAFTQEDRAAFADGRIAGLKAALKLTADQEKLWPPVEQALRDTAKQRAEARERMRERWASFRADREAGRPIQRNIPEDLKNRADRMAAAASNLRKLADASAPLYASLDEGQKRRLGMLMRFAGQDRMRGHRHGWQRHGWRDEHRGFRDERRGERRERRGSLEERGSFGERDFRGERGRYAELDGPRGFERRGYGEGRGYGEERGYGERRGYDRDADDDHVESRRFQ